MTSILIAALAVWLLILTIAVWGLARNLGVMAMAQQAGPLPLATVNLDENGPPVGANAPANLFSASGIETDERGKLMLFLSVGCGTCLEVASGLQHERDLGDLLPIVVGPAASEAARELDRALHVLGVGVVRGDRARSVMQGLGVSAIPFAVRVANDRVTASRYVRKASDVAELINAVRVEEAGRP